MTDRHHAPGLDLGRQRSVHLVGIGGAGMSGLARILIQRGHTTSGSDLRDSRALQDLTRLGVHVVVGHGADNLPSDVDAVVVSTAVRPDNVEVMAARGRNVPVLHRAELLAALMADDERVLVAGTHGKTTTTAMCVVALQGAGQDPSFAVGSKLNEIGTNAHGGTDPVFVAEADESDRSLLHLRPRIAVVLNAELDHPDEFAAASEVHDVFTAFLDRLDPDGVAVLCLDDPGTVRLVDHGCRVVTYGRDPRADLRLVIAPDGSSRVLVDGQDVPLALAVPGVHNRLNAVAALAVCRELGVEIATAAEALAAFRGTQRRFQELDIVRGVRVVDDYAHHPTELAATLSAARDVHDGRIIVVVQPHRYSRTRVLGAELGRAAAAADLVVVTDVYAASETPEPGVTGALVADAARAAGARVTYVPHLSEVAPTVADMAASGDLVLVTGAGDVTQVGPDVLSRLRGG